MINFDQISEGQIRAVEASTGETLQVALKSDMGTEMVFGEAFLYATAKSLLVAKGDDLKTYPFEDMKAIKLNFYVSGGALALELAEGWQEVLYFSSAVIGKMNQVDKLLNKLREGQVISDADLKEEDLRKHCPKCGRLYPDPNIEVCPKCLNRGSLFVRLMAYLKDFKGQAALLVLMMLLSAVFSVARPYLTGQVLVDDVLPKEGRYHGHLLEVILLILLVHTISVFFQIMQGRLNSVITGKMIYTLKKDIFSAMQRLSMSFYTKRQTGKLMTRVNGDATHVQYFFHDGLPYLVMNSFVIVGILTMMFVTKWQLALMVLIPVPFIALMVLKVFPKFHKLFRKRYRVTSKLNNIINDSLTGIRVVKAFGKEGEEIERFKGSNAKVSMVEREVGVFSGTVMPLMYFMLSVGGLIVWGFGGYMTIQGSISFGTIITFTGYLGMLYQPIQYMIEIVQWWSDCMNSAKRIFDIIDAKADIVNAIDAQKIEEIQGNIQLKDISFGYESHKPVIKHVTLDIEAGQMIGLVGHSGAGKSTITNLISRLYEVDEGQIIIDGVDIKALDLDSLHAQVGMVLQETFLFSGTVAENIAYAKPESSMMDIILAAKAANAHEFILELDDGYNTLLGNRGQDLSGGQRQRIAIARAILQNPRILILDEATASMDTETELNIQEALESLTKGRTTIAIAHRLSTLRNAHQLVVVDQGEIAEQGSHESLMALKGKYYDMVQEQKKALKYQGI